MAKMENRYLKEWVDYHLRIGFDHIFIYDNNEKNGEKCEDCILEEVKSGKVTVIDYRGKTQTACQIQVKAYEECYTQNSALYKWFMFLDVDEFLVLNQHRNVPEYLNDPAFAKMNCIRINWKCFTDNNLQHYEDKPVRERFTETSKNKEVNKYYKYFIRSGIYKLRIPNVHHTSNVTNVCLNDGTPTPYNACTKLATINHEWAYIAHYVTKSMDEYVEIKRKRRGNGSSKNRLTTAFYWQYNNFDPQRDKILKKMFGEI